MQCRGKAVVLGKSCRKALTGLQRGPYGDATGPPPDDESGPVVNPGGPYGRKKVVFQDKNRGRKTTDFRVPEKP